MVITIKPSREHDELEGISPDQHHEQNHTHGSHTALTVDDHPQYVLEDGRSGGQDIIGGTAASDDLTLESTSNATKGEITVKDILMPDADDTLDLGTDAIAFKKMHSNEGFTLTTTGGACARIPANSYGFAIDGQPNSGVYFDNTAPKGISIHISGVEKHMFHAAVASSEGAFYHLLRTADPTDTGIADGTLCMVKVSGTYYLKVYDSGANTWKTLASV